MLDALFASLIISGAFVGFDDLLTLSFFLTTRLTTRLLFFLPISVLKPDSATALVEPESVKPGSVKGLKVSFFDFEDLLMLTVSFLFVILVLVRKPN